MKCFTVAHKIVDYLLVQISESFHNTFQILIELMVKTYTEFHKNFN